MPSCTFLKCKNRTKIVNKNSGITFHSFPSDVEMREKWISIIRQDRNNDEWIWNKSCRICSVHFSEDEIFLTKQGMRKINKDAIPKPRYKISNKYNSTTQSSASTKKNFQNENELGQSDTTVSSSVITTPGRADLIKRIRRLEQENSACKIKIKCLAQKNRRLKVKCVTLKSIIQTLEKKYYDYVDCLQVKKLKCEASD